MSTYDVEMNVTMRLDAHNMEDAKIQAYLTAEEHLYGGIMMPAPGELKTTQTQIDERRERTGIDLRVVASERVVTAQPYGVAG